MAGAFDTLPKLSFAGIEFPYDAIEIVGGLRDHVHEYPKVDGGDPELMGRKLYVFKVKANFQRTFRDYPDLYPKRITELNDALDGSKIAKLVIPQFGIVERAYAFNWTRQISVKVRSGERFDIEFREESIKERSAFEFITRAASLSDVPLLDAAAKKPDLLSAIGNAIQAVQNGINAVTAVADQAEMYGNLLEAKVVQLQVALEEFDRIDEMQEAENYPVVDALRDLQATAARLLEDLLGRGGGIDTYVTPTVMPVQQVANDIYGDTSRAMDLLHLNPIENAFAIPAGFPIRYYRAA